MEMGRCVCSDILTFLPAIGIPFEIDDIEGPIIENPIRSADGVSFEVALWLRMRLKDQ